MSRLFDTADDYDRYQTTEAGGLEGLDRDRCQREYPRGPFMFGPRPSRPVRCSAVPSIALVESSAGSDGLIGAMSLCGTCLEEFEKGAPVGSFYTLPLASGGP